MKVPKIQKTLKHFLTCRNLIKIQIKMSDKDSHIHSNNHSHKPRHKPSYKPTSRIFPRAPKKNTSISINALTIARGV